MSSIVSFGISIQTVCPLDDTCIDSIVTTRRAEPGLEKVSEVGTPSGSHMVVNDRTQLAFGLY